MCMLLTGGDKTPGRREGENEERGEDEENERRGRGRS